MAVYECSDCGSREAYAGGPLRPGWVCDGDRCYEGQAVPVEPEPEPGGPVGSCPYCGGPVYSDGSAAHARNCSWAHVTAGRCNDITDYAPDVSPQIRNPQDVLRGLPDDAAARKDIPLMTGLVDYFPLALQEIAAVSKAGNDQHNPGQPLHWARGKSTDHADCTMRHLVDRGTRDTDGHRHTAKAAWRVLALLQEECEADAGFTPEEA